MFFLAKVSLNPIEMVSKKYMFINHSNKLQDLSVLGMVQILFLIGHSNIDAYRKGLTGEAVPWAVTQAQRDHRVVSESAMKALEVRSKVTRYIN